MDNLLNLALFVLSDVLPAQRKPSNTRRVTTAAILAAFAAVALVAGLGCAVAALWIYLAAMYGALGGAIGSTAVLLILSGALVVIARNQFRDQEKPATGKVSLGEELGAELQLLFTRHKGSALLSALLAGLAAGRGK
jgi:hypothetical protein